MSHSRILPFKGRFILDCGFVDLFPQETQFYKFGWKIGAK